MPQQTYSVSENVKVQVRGCRDRVVVSGWNDARTVAVDAPARLEGDTLIVENARRVSIKAPMTASLAISDSSADLRIDGLSGKVELSGIRGDTVLRGLADVFIRDLRGDLSVRGVAALRGEGAWEGNVSLRDADRFEIGEMEGDLSIGDVREITIQSLEGDLSARGVGSLRLGDVHGDVSVRDVGGDVHLAELSGDLIASGVRGAVNAPDVDGDAVLSFEEVKGAVVRAHGDVVVNLPVKADADIELDAPHGDIVARAPIHVTEQDENHLRGTLGNGGAKVQIESAHDDLILRVGPGGAPHFDQDEMRAPFIKMGQDFADMGQDFSEMGRRIAEETRRSVEESLARSGVHQRHKHHFHSRRSRSEEQVGTQEPQEKKKPEGPAAGSPERKAILDAIARGELSVDDAIRKIRGEE